jgi:hypothetical protein
MRGGIGGFRVRNKGWNKEWSRRIQFFLLPWLVEKLPTKSGGVPENMGTDFIF